MVVRLYNSINAKRLIKKKGNYKKRIYKNRVEKVLLDEGVYEVDKILAKRGSSTATEYFVSWSGYDAHENTWIPDLPSYFEEEWGPSGNKEFQENNVFNCMVEIACLLVNAT